MAKQVQKYILDHRGFSLIEASIALGIGLIFLASVLSVWFFSTKVWKEESLRSELRYAVERSVEKIKADTRLSDQNSMLFYPSTAASSNYTAISLAYPPADSSAPGFLKLSSGAIDWSQGKTIIYSIYNNPSTGKQEFRRTTFNSFNTDTATRQTQLNTVATTGTASGASRTVLFSADSITFQVTASNSTFDGYASSTQLSANTNFGGYRLSSGTHQIKFLITGKNSSSSGYQLGIDDISLEPSGGPQETEDLTVSSSSGQTVNYEDMTSYTGTWGGNYQTEYQSSAAGNYIIFQTNYDQWLESNFENMTHSDTEVIGTNPVLTVMSREDQSLTPAWQATAQTSLTSAGSTADNTESGSKSIRCVVLGSSISRAGTMIRFKFTAGDTGDLVISAAYFGPRDDANPWNFSPLILAPTQLYFDNPEVANGDADGVGAMNPGTATGITIHTGHHAWTNWFEPTAPSYASLPVSNQLISLYVLGTAMSWVDDDTSPEPQYFYIVDGNEAASMADWSSLPGYNNQNADGKKAVIYALEKIASWNSTGTATSQVYDTKMSAPAYNQISWTSVLPSASTATVSVRSSASADMTGASAWTPFILSPSPLLAIPNNRYVQFQAQLQTGTPYTTYPTLDKVNITWPGQTALVQISGHFTKKPDYGIFQVLVDGNSLVKTLGVSLTATTNYRGEAFTNSATADIKPRNTAK